MEDSLPSSAPQDIYVSQKLKSFMSEPQGCALITALESQFQCSITIDNDALRVSNGADGNPVDISQIESIIRDVWQKRDVQLMIREAALNVSCTHVCQTILPRAYCAVVFFFSADFQRRSRCNDLIIEHFTGKVSIFGTEQTVNAARDLMIECLTEHFGLLEMIIPAARQTTRVGYDSNGSFNSSASSSTPLFLDGAFSMGEPNAILSSTPPQSTVFNDALHSSNFFSPPTFQPDFSMPPPPVPTQQFVEMAKSTNNVEKIKHWISSEEVGKILGNRAAMKKQIEAQFNCVITVHTEVYPQFGMTAVEIMAQNKDQCQGARDAIMGLMKSHQDIPTAKSPSTDSGFTSPTSTIDSSATTPEKRSSSSRQFHRSSFRDQPKVMLALTPRKNSQPAD
uniref:K Homology domain-containing protein n=1 Tax=Caenorhabditis japonica TaxID=281687 RepID=A0A8R1HV23_CAEJA